LITQIRLGGRGGLYLAGRFFLFDFCSFSLLSRAKRSVLYFPREFFFPFSCAVLQKK
jgi:hypothetical protein